VRNTHARAPQGLRLLSAGADRSFRLFSTIQDQQSRELSQKHTAARAKRARATQTEMRLPRVVGLAACEVRCGARASSVFECARVRVGRACACASCGRSTQCARHRRRSACPRRTAPQARERDWANVITAHAGDPAAYTWRLAHFTLGEHVLLPPPDAGSSGGDAGRQQQQQQQQRAPVTAVAISACGNFALVGSEAGRVDRYNLQSGMHRGAYTRQPAGSPAAAAAAAGAAAAAAAAGPALPAHEGLVAGLASDATNKLLVSAGGDDAALRVWDFRRLKLRAELALGSPATHVALHAGSSLAAVGCVDRGVRVVDVEAARVVRRFTGHRCVGAVFLLGRGACG
jgi:U3 small nucleolar RNA-associated protein 21